MELDEMEQTLQDIFDKIKDFTTNDEKIPAENGTNIADTINKISIQADALTNYWNNSVKNLSKKIDDYFNSTEFRSSNSAQGEDKKYRDAGFSFSTSPYVKPNENVDGDTYEESRTDAMTSVLKNKDYLDYTISAEELSEQVTRLLMPQNARRVEVEDLNRNFWVIGQNLTALNNTISKLNNDILKNLLYELVKLWQNVYRIWQGIAFLYDYVNKTVENISVQNNSVDTTVLISYGFKTGVDNAAEVQKEYISNNQFLPIDKYNAKNFGILPYIREVNMDVTASTQDDGNILYSENDNDTKKYLYYMPYNQLLTDDIIKELEEDHSQDTVDRGIKTTKFDTEYLYNIEKNKSKTQPSFIQIDNPAPYRSTKEILEEVRARNFVLVYPTDKKLDFIPKVNDISMPNSTFLRLYRDYLYYTKDADLSEPVANILKVTLDKENKVTDDDTYRTVRQISGLENFYSDEEENTFNNGVFTDANKNICKFVKSTFCKENDLPTHFIDAFCSSSNLEDFKKKLENITVSKADDAPTGTTISTPAYTTLTNEFYILCTAYMKKVCPTKLIPTYFLPNSSETYTLTKDEDVATINALTESLENWDKTNSLDGEGTYKGLTDIKFDRLESQKPEECVQWDLLSMVLDESLEMTDDTYNKNDFPSGQWFKEKPIVKHDLHGAVIDDFYFGTEFIYFRKNPINLRIKFVENAYFKDSSRTCSKIGSFTFNDFHGDMFSTNNNILTYDPLWFARTVSNFNISIPFTVPAGLPYESFVRANKPYPDIMKILGLNNGNSISSKRFENKNAVTKVITETSDKVLSTKYYEDILNKTDNYATVTDGLKNELANGNKKYTDYILKNGIFIDGFYGQNRVLYLEQLDYMGSSHDIDRRDHPPILYLNSMSYGIASSDLTGSDADEKCQTRKDNKNGFESPILNLRYIGSGNDWQEIEIILTKDKTGFFELPKKEEDPKPESKPEKTEVKPILSEKPLQAISVRIGDFYPVGANTNTTVNTSDFKEVTSFKPEDKYNISTYGLGSYYMESETYQSHKETDTNTANNPLYALKYVDYYDFNTEKQKNASNGTVTVQNLSELNTAITNKDNENSVIEHSKKYIKALKEKNNEYLEYLDSSLIYTRIGKESWQGVNGSQWSGGIICHMYYMIEGEPYLLGEVMRYDGYFDDLHDQTHNPTNTTYPCFNTKDRHRHLIIAEDSGRVPFAYRQETDGDESDTIKGYFLPKKMTGYILWFDKTATGTWKQDPSDNILAVENDLIVRPSKGTKNSVYYKGNKVFKNDEEFRNFVRDSFLNSANLGNITNKDTYAHYERLVGVVPFEIDLSAPENENQDLTEIFPEEGQYDVDKIKEDYYFVKQLDSIKNTGKMKVLDEYSLVRYSCLEGRPGFTHIYKLIEKKEQQKDYEKNDVFEETKTGMADNIMSSLLPEVSVYLQNGNENFKKDPTTAGEAVSFISGQKAYFPLTPDK